jgi:hypothetical protein
MGGDQFQGKNVKLGTYHNIDLEIFWGGLVQYLNKLLYSNFLGRTSQKRHPVKLQLFLLSTGFY